MAEEWFLQIGKKRHGPFTVEQLRRMADANQLREADLLWKDGLAKPVAATSIAGIFNYGLAKKKVRDPETPAAGTPTGKGIPLLPIGAVLAGFAIAVVAVDALRPAKRTSQTIPGNGFGQKVAAAQPQEEVPPAHANDQAAGEANNAQFKRTSNTGQSTPVVSVDELVSEYARPGSGGRDRYHGKELIVTGVVDYPLSLEKDFGVFLKTPGTGGLKVVARFPTTFNPDPQRLAAGNAIAVHGVCASMQDNSQPALHQAIQLMDCAAMDPMHLERNPARTETASTAGATTPRVPDVKPIPASLSGSGLTESYFPFKPGRVLVYDVAALTGAGATVLRHRFTLSEEPMERDVTRAERETIKLGTLLGGTLLQGGQVKWTREVKQKSLFPFHFRGNSEHIEMGQHLTNDARIYWEPILKLGTKPGDHWDWHGPAGVTRYEFLRVDRHKGRPAVVIQSTMPPESAPQVTTHVYVEGVGEVERTTTNLIAGTVVITGQTRLVEDE